jgi:CHAT domain-containing protein/tetratricopeptide (TPR) repeat protein
MRRGLNWSTCLVVLLFAARLAAAPETSNTAGEQGKAASDAIQRLIDAGRYASADSAGEALVRTARAARHPEPAVLARALETWAQARSFNNKATDSLTIALQLEALRLTESDLHADPQDLANRLGNTGRTFQVAGQPKKAVPYLQRAIDQSLKAFGPSSLQANKSRVVYGNCLCDLARYAEAESVYTAAIDGFMHNEQRKAADLAAAQNGLGIATAQQGKLVQARDAFSAALPNYVEGAGPFHPRTNQCRENLAVVFNLLGDLAGARAMSQNALAAQIAALGPGHEKVALSLCNLGSILIDMGEYAAARDTLERAIAIYETTRGKDDFELADPLLNLGRVLELLGEGTRAEAAIARSLAIREAHRPSDDPDLIGNLLARAELEDSQGREAGARRDLERAQSICMARQGFRHPNAGLVYRAFAEFEFAHDRFDSAAAKCDEALPGLRAGLGPTHPGVLQLLTMRCRADLAVGKTEGVDDTLAGIVRLLEEDPGVSPSVLHEPMALLSEAQWRRGDSAAAVTTAIQADVELLKFLVLVVQGVPERAALHVVAEPRSALDHLLDWAPTSPEAARAAEEAVASNRGLVLDEMARRRRLVCAGEANPNVRASAARLTAARSQLAYLVLGGNGDDPDSYPQRLANAAALKERLERELAAQLPVTVMTSEPTVTWDRMRKRLGPDAVLVSYVRHIPFTHSSLHKPASVYLAFICRADRTRAISLGDASRIDDLVRQWRAVVAKLPSSGSELATDAAERRIGSALRRAIWDPVAQQFSGSSHVFVVPDGALQFVNLLALPTGTTGYVVEEGPLVQMLSTERDLLREERGKPGSGMLSFGGIDFGSGSPALVANDRGAEGGSSSVQAEYASDSVATYRSAIPTCDLTQSLTFAELPGSENEARSIAAAWPPAEGAADLYTRQQASELAFKRFAPGKRVLHLATHGFCLPEGCDLTEPSSAHASLAATNVTSGHPLLLSGLALADANLRRGSGSATEDGLLTAEEISALDLSGIEWVVLSACGSGLGVEESGEGLFGLRRAFAIAGARNVIASLWNVNDRSTAPWAQDLYSARVRERDAAQAVRDADRAALRRRRELRWSTNPFYWGAFVATGP